MNKESICLAAIGDLALGDHPARVGNGVGSIIKQEEKGFIFKKVADVFTEYDMIIGNLEYAFKEEPKKLNLLESQCIASPKCANILAALGVNVLNLANNHSAQFGHESFSETVSLLKKNNISPVGIVENTSSSKPVIWEVRGIRLGFLGYSLRPRQHFDENPPYAEGTPEKIIQAIKDFKRNVDHVAVSLHWGDEFIEKPSPDEIILARKMIDSGASLVLGHHPHVLRGIESYNGGVIAYSLGNFICDMHWENRLRESMVLEINIFRNKIGEYNIIPVYINDSFQPVPIEDEKEKHSFFKRQKRRNNHIEDVLNFYTPEKYKKEALNELIKNRRASHKYFFSHITEYNPKIIFQQFLHSIKNRIQEGLYW